ncbi:MAG: hypothetical protein CSA66_04045 [Proteobacteria bacterium]|nr:MAG: hypothetical protein CSA66_04045 [Pseudomonadota bacterium]
MSPPKPVLVVSACLLGQPCRYDGASRRADQVLAAAARWIDGGGRVAPVCPEELGGLGTPRPGAELRGGDGEAALAGAATVAREADGVDVTAAFLAGAQRAMALAGGAPARAILKARSPSCGVGRTHIDGGVRDGDGVFAALLARAGVSRQTDEDLADADGG